VPHVIQEGEIWNFIMMKLHCNCMLMMVPEITLPYPFMEMATACSSQQACFLWAMRAAENLLK
jgi:hypothetical protein